jgi:hypothetical protein
MGDLPPQCGGSPMPFKAYILTDPLQTEVQNPQHRLQDRSRWHRLAAWAPLRDLFLGEMFPNPFPLVIAQSQHACTYT